MTSPAPLSVIDPAAIPGMIEPIEQKLMTHLARTVPVQPGDGIVEFGTFFGRSTACLVNGLVSRDDPAAAAVTVYAFDKFSCAVSNPFASLIGHHARSQSLESLLEERDGKVTFRKIFDRFLDEPQDEGRLIVGEGDLDDAQCSCDAIALMHVDAPKNYETLKHILFEFFPRLRPGASVVFQDYFYHWSATLIAAIQHLVEGHILTLRQSAASSVVAEVVNQPHPSLLRAVDAKMHNGDHAATIDRALSSVASMSVDRPGQFVPRLALSKIPEQWQSGDYKGSNKSLRHALTLARTTEERSLVFQDFSDLMMFGFDYDYD